MPRARPSVQPEYELTDAQIDELIAHPYWESLGEVTDSLIQKGVPETTEIAERTTLLTWIYQQQGVMTFEDLAQRLTGMDNISRRKKHLRQALRSMQKLLLVNIVNFPVEGEEVEDVDETVVGHSSMVSITWTGMLWLRRAWNARERLTPHRSIAQVHEYLVKEEDDAGWHEPYWVENIAAADPEGSHKRAQRVAEALPAINSIFQLAQAQARKR